MKNRYGLTKDPPADVKREVRQRDGFGCVICGEALIEYDHVDPEFADARKHEAKGIALLCKHHHGMKTRKFLPKSAVVAAMANPHAVKQNRATSMLHVFTDLPSVLIGSTVTQSLVILRHNGRDVIWFRCDQGQHLLNVKLFDARSAIGLHIEDNEIRVNRGNAWDFQASGGSYFIHSARRLEAIRIAIDSDHGFVIPKMSMLIGKTMVRVSAGVLTIGKATFVEGGMFGSECAIAFDD